MNPIIIEPIGTIYTPHAQIEGMPVQPAGAAGITGKAVLKEEYVEGLTDLEGFSHATFLYHFHKTEGYTLMPVPFMDTKPHGIFATRAPKRPNHIGMSTVRILAIEGDTVTFDGADMLNGTPLIDIKPYFPRYDSPEDTKSGWLDSAAHANCGNVRSDNRFMQTSPSTSPLTSPPTSPPAPLRKERGGISPQPQLSSVFPPSPFGEGQGVRRYHLPGWILLLFVVVFFSCEQDSNYRFKGMPDEDEYIPSGDGNYPAEGGLLFHEDFRSWVREGYENAVAQDCENAPMITSTIMYTPSKPRIGEYGGFTVAYTLRDFAVNPACGVKAGISTADSEISPGYVALQQLIFYECGQHDSDAMMQLSVLPSVSKVRFSVSLGGRIEDVAGISLWKKAGGETAFTKVGDFIPSDPEAGEVFTVEMNEENVQLKFIPALTGRENPVNDGINRAVRIHDLWVW